jgi:chemotaxis protein CheD
MSHCLLATKPSHRRPGDESHRHAYVDGTFEEMLAFFRQEGIAPSALEVKLFGGADVIQVLSGPKSVGRENINAAHRIMAHQGLRVAASDTGGNVGRRIQFATHTGIVHVHKMRSADGLRASSLARQSG